MMSDHKWKIQSIDLNEIHKISQSRTIKNPFFQVKHYTVYLSPSLDLIEGLYAYQDPISDEAILSEINPLLVHLK